MRFGCRGSIILPIFGASGGGQLPRPRRLGALLAALISQSTPLVHETVDIGKAKESAPGDGQQRFQATLAGELTHSLVAKLESPGSISY
jgi:hypothetical protein